MPSNAYQSVDVNMPIPNQTPKRPGTPSAVGAPVSGILGQIHVSIAVNTNATTIQMMVMPMPVSQRLRPGFHDPPGTASGQPRPITPNVTVPMSRKNDIGRYQFTNH